VLQPPFHVMNNFQNRAGVTKGVQKFKKISIPEGIFKEFFFVYSDRHEYVLHFISYKLVAYYFC